MPDIHCTSLQWMLWRFFTLQKQVTPPFPESTYSRCVVNGWRARITIFSFYRLPKIPPESYFVLSWGRRWCWGCRGDGMLLSPPVTAAPRCTRGPSVPSEWPCSTGAAFVLHWGVRRGLVMGAVAARVGDGFFQVWVNSSLYGKRQGLKRLLFKLKSWKALQM